MAAAKGMEASARVRWLAGISRKAISAKRRGSPLREIVALKARSRGPVGLLRNVVGRARPAAVEAGTIPSAPVLGRTERRLHTVIGLLRRPVISDSGRLITPVEAISRANPCIALRRVACESLPITRVVPAPGTVASRIPGVAVAGKRPAATMRKAPVRHGGAVREIA